MKFTEYVIMPIFYSIILILTIFKYKIIFDRNTALTIFIIGLILIPFNYLLLRLIPNLSEIQQPQLPTVAIPNYTAFAFRSALFSIPLIEIFFLSFLFSIFIAQYSRNKIYKMLIFISIGIVLFFVLVSLESQAYSFFVI